MNKLVKENLFEFTRNSDPLDTLDIGYASKIHKFFDDLGISRNAYTVKNSKIIFFGTLNLYGNKNLVELPDNIMTATLDLSYCENLIKLPNNLVVDNYLELRGCKKIINLPDSLIVDTYIYLDENQTELISFLKNSKFKDQYRINL